MTYLLFAVALSLSAISAYYAVMGLIAIFAAAVVPIAIMGSLLEISKLTVASWLYQNWKQVPKLMKTYFAISLVVLMMLTSMGIFGFLSKAHLDQAVPTGDVSAKLALIDEKIKTEKENINAARTTIAQLDRQVDETLNRTATQDNNAGVNRSISIRRSQQAERKRALDEIGRAQTAIAGLNEERAPIATQVRKVEAEVGPIKYIAELIYGDQAKDEGFLEKAVRIVTLMIVAVFDPLAVLLLIAANWNMKHYNHGHWTEFFRKEKSEEFPEIKEIGVEDKIDLDDTPKVNQTKDDLDIPEEGDWDKRFYDRVGSEIPEIEVDEPVKDEAPAKYPIKRGDVVLQEDYPDNKDVPPKTASFMRKMADFLRPQSAGVITKTIEVEVDELQKK